MDTKQAQITAGGVPPSDYLSNFHRNEAIICLIFLVMFIVILLNPAISFVPFLACAPGGFAFSHGRDQRGECPSREKEPSVVR